MALSARDDEGQGSYPAAATAAAAVSDSNSSILSIDAEVAICVREITLVDENIQRVESALEGNTDFMGMRGMPDRVALLRCLDALRREKGRQREKEAQLREQRRQGLLPVPPTGSNDNNSSDVELIADGKATSSKESGPRKPALKWEILSRRLLMSQVMRERPFLARFNKNQRLGECWDVLAEALSVFPPFVGVGGITGRACRAKYKEIMMAHRQEIEDGQCVDGVCEGVDGVTHRAIHACMQHEDEGLEFAAKSKGGAAEYEAFKQLQAEKAQASALRAGDVGKGKKRKSNGASAAGAASAAAGGSGSGSLGLSSEDDEEPPLSSSEKRGAIPNVRSTPNVPSVPNVISVEDAVANYFAHAVDSPRTKNRKLAMAEKEMEIKQADVMIRQTQATTIRDLMRSTHDSPTSKSKRLSIEEINANARMREIEVRAEEAKATRLFMSQMTSIMEKLANKLS